MSGNEYYTYAMRCVCIANATVLYMYTCDMCVYKNVSLTLIFHAEMQFCSRKTAVKTNFKVLLGSSALRKIPCSSPIVESESLNLDVERENHTLFRGCHGF